MHSREASYDVTCEVDMCEVDETSDVERERVSDVGA